MQYLQFKFDFVTKTIGKYAILLPVGENNFHGIGLFNHSSIFVVGLLRTHTMSETIDIFSKQFDLSREQAEKDCKTIAKALIDGGIAYEIQ